MKVAGRACAQAARRVKMGLARVMLFRVENVAGIAGVVKMKSGVRGVTELGVWNTVVGMVSLIVVICELVAVPLEKHHVL